jgi:L-iditol 2-dehydrogenase
MATPPYNGGLQKYISFPTQKVYKLPDNVSTMEGALLEPLSVGLHAVQRGEVSLGSSVAILGGGTIGIFTMQWAKLLGAKNVVVFDISNDRLALAKRLGADGTVNTLKDNYIDEALAFTNGSGFDYVYETAGVTVTMKTAFTLAGNKAHVCFIGTPHKELSFTPAEWENMNRKEFRLTGSWMSYSAPFPGKEWSMTAEYYAAGKLKFDEGLIGERIPMAKAQEAFQMFKTPEAVKGKILLINNL